MTTEETLLNWARPEIVSLKAYQSAREEFVGGTREMILLDANENPYPSSVNRYPDPMQVELKKRIAQHKQTAEDHIFVGNGSDEVLSLLMQIFCVPNKDKAILLPPTFGMYQVCADIHGVETLSVPLTEDFQLDLAAIRAAYAHQPKMIFIPSPNNPTGNCFDREQIISIVKEFNGLVVVDEAYVEFAENQSLLPELSQYPNLVVVQTFSKAQGMAGVRLGMCFAHPTVIALFNRIKAPYNINSLTQKAVIEQLDKQSLVAKQVEEMLSEKARVISTLSKIDFIQKIYPSDANFFLVKVDDSQQRYHQFIEQGIVVRNPSKQTLCANTLRISIGTPAENNALLNACNQMNHS